MPVTPMRLGRFFTCFAQFEPRALTSSDNYRCRYAAVVIAAGQAIRLRPYSEQKPKALMEIAPGVAIIDLVIRQFATVGIKDVIVVTRSDYVEFFEAHLKGNARVIAAEDNGFENLHSLEMGLAATSADRIVLAMSDHIFEVDILRRLIHAGCANGKMILCLDKMPNHRDLREGLRVSAHLNGVLRVGKEIPPHSGIDTGLFIIPSEMHELVSKLRTKNGKATISDLVNVLAGEGRVGYVDVTGRLWLDIDTPQDLEQSRSIYWEVLRRGLPKQTDGPISRFLNRPLSTRLTIFLYRHASWATPNRLTAVSFLLAISAALFFSQRQFVFGALLVQFSSILDGADGELARLRGVASKFGVLLDSFLDRIADATLIITLGLTLIPSSFSLVLTGLAVLGVVLVSYVTNLAIEQSEPARLRRGFPWATRDVRLFSMTIGGLLSIPILPMLFCALSPPIFAVRALWAMIPRARSPIKPANTLTALEQPQPVISYDPQPADDQVIRKNLVSVISNFLKIVVALAVLQFTKATFSHPLQWIETYLPDMINFDLLYDLTRLLVVVYFGYRLLLPTKFFVDLASDAVVTKFQITRGMYARITTDVLLLGAVCAVWWLASPVLGRLPDIGANVELGGGLLVLGFIVLVLYDLMKIVDRGLRWVWDAAITHLTGIVAKYVHHDRDRDSENLTKRDSDNG